jgi:hypothetical protein
MSKKHCGLVRFGKYPVWSTTKEDCDDAAEGSSELSCGIGATISELAMWQIHSNFDSLDKACFVMRPARRVKFLQQSFGYNMFVTSGNASANYSRDGK